MIQSAQGHYVSQHKALAVFPDILNTVGRSIRQINYTIHLFNGHASIGCIVLVTDNCMLATGCNAIYSNAIITSDGQHCIRRNSCK